MAQQRGVATATQNARLLVVGGLMAVVVAVGGALHAMDGLPSRWSKEAFAPIASSWARTIPAAARCARVSAEIAGVSGLCRLGEEDAPLDFMVWGDSHAAAMLPAFEKVALDRGLNGAVVAKHACMGALGFRNVQMPVWHGCPEHNERVIAYARDMKPRVVFMVSRWTQSQSPALAYEIEGPDAASTFAAALTRSHDALLAAGVEHVVWVRSVPEFDFHVANALAKAREWGKTLPTLPRAMYDRQQAILVGLPLTNPAFTVIAPAEEFCDAETCRYDIDDVALYRDDDHISAFGAERLAEPIIRQVAHLFTAGEAQQIAALPDAGHAPEQDRF